MFVEAGLTGGYPPQSFSGLEVVGPLLEIAGRAMPGWGPFTGPEGRPQPTTSMTISENYRSLTLRRSG